MRFGNVAEWDALITDASADPDVLKSLKSKGVRILHALERKHHDDRNSGQRDEAHEELGAR
jgi:hypothetical protein